jgi:hypothetical protein
MCEFENYLPPGSLIEVSTACPGDVIIVSIECAEFSSTVIRKGIPCITIARINT